MKRRNYLTKIIVTLAWVSLLSDIASEMLYPIMPVYLTSIGFSALWIGILEGFAETVVGFSKAYFGFFSDRSAKRVPFIRVGYFLSAISKPAMALFQQPLWIFTSRSADRLGKGIRTGARDAMLTDESAVEHRGKVFGFHRGMDTMGAAIGPCCALVYLYFFPGDYKTLFLIAFLPGLSGVALTFLLKDKNAISQGDSMAIKPFGYFSYWRRAGHDYKKVLAGFVAFALFNSSDVFILLIARHNGLSDTTIIAGYIFYNLVYALAAFPAGSLADRYGPKKMFLAGLLFFVTAYALMPVAGTFYGLLVAFLFYGLYAACTEGVSKAWISMLCPKEERATALGFFSGLVSIMALLSGIVAGILWIKFSPLAVFIFSAAGAMLVGIYFSSIKKVQHPSPDR